jgi:hypothetical protein
VSSRSRSRFPAQAVASVILANFPSKQGNNLPPDGLLWGDGELGGLRRRTPAGGSPDVKGVFGEGASVVAVPPRPPPAPGPAGPAAVASLFASDLRVATPAVATDDNRAHPDQSGAKNRGLWSGAETEPATRPRIRMPHHGLPRAVAGGSAQTAAAGSISGVQASVPNVAPQPDVTDSAEFAVAKPAELELESAAASRVLPPASPNVQPAQRAEPPAPDAVAHATQRALIHAPNTSVSPSSHAQRSAMPAELQPVSSIPASRGDLARTSLPLVAAGIRPRRVTAARLLLGAFGILIAVSAGLIAGAQAGLWTLPPAAAAMLGHEAAPAPLHPTQPVAPTPLAAQPAPVAQVPSALPSAVAEPPAEPTRPTEQEPTQLGAQPTTAEPAQAKAPGNAPEELEPAPAEPVAAHPEPAVTHAAPVQPATTNEGTTSVSNLKLLQQARAKQQADDLPEAEALLRRALANDPDDHHSMEVLVQVLIEGERGPEALKYAEEIVRKRPKRASYRVLAGDALLLTGDKIGAQRAWREALALEPGNREARRRLSAQ